MTNTTLGYYSLSNTITAAGTPGSNYTLCLWESYPSTSRALTVTFGALLTLGTFRSALVYSTPISNLVTMYQSCQPPIMDQGNCGRCVRVLLTVTLFSDLHQHSHSVTHMHSLAPCNSCYAHAAATMASASFCIQTGGTIFNQISPQFLLNMREQLGYVLDEMAGMSVILGSPCSGGKPLSCICLLVFRLSVIFDPFARSFRTFPPFRLSVSVDGFVPSRAGPSRRGPSVTQAAQRRRSFRLHTVHSSVRSLVSSVPPCPSLRLSVLFQPGRVDGVYARPAGKRGGRTVRDRFFTPYLFSHMKSHR